MNLREKLSTVKKYFRRFNQVVLTFPVWIVLGISGILRSREETGWIKSEENDSFGKMH